MTQNKTPNTPTSAQQARANYQRLRYVRSAPNAINAPSFKEALLPDIPGDETNMLPLPHAVDRAVLIPFFDVIGDPGDPGILRLLWNGTTVGASVAFQLPLDPASFPLEMTLPAANTATHGRHSLAYRANILGNLKDSDPLSVFIDNNAPNLNHPGDAAVLPPDVENGGITREYLDDNNGEVGITINTYQDIKVEDKVDVWLARTYPGTRVDTVTITDITAPITATLTEADFNQIEGQYLIYYKLSDRTGNVGPDSAVKYVNVFLTEGPDNLVPPKVPQADDGLIDLDDAQEGVGVQIDEYDNAASGDLIQVYWKGVPVPGRVPVDPSNFPVFVTVPYGTVRETPPDWGPRDVHITYEVIRDTRKFPEPTGIDVDIDLRVPGPPNPDPDPDPELGNPALDPVVVTGAVTTTPPNELNPPDAGQDATAKVNLYVGATAGEVMHLLWNGKEVATYTVSATDAPGDEIEFTIPWDDIEAAGNNAALPVRYTITHAANDNENRSPVTAVRVNVLTITLPAITFQNLDPDFSLLNCSSLRQVGGVWGIEVRVAGSAQKVLAGHTLTFNYQGWLDAAGTTPKPGTEASFTRIPTEDEALNGFTALIPYTPAVLATLDKWGSIKYELVLDGFLISAPRDIKRVYMSVPGGGTCPLTLRTATRVKKTLKTPL